MPYTAADVDRILGNNKRGSISNRNSESSNGKWSAADVSKVLREREASRNGSGIERNVELDDELYTRRTGRPAAGTMPNRTRTNDEDEPSGLLGQLGSLLQRSTELQNRTAYRNEEIRREAEEVLGRPARENEARYNAYNQWLEEGDNRQRLNDLVQSEQAARKEADIDERMHKLGYTDGEIEEIRARRREYQQSVPFGYDITHRIASSVEGIASQAAGAAFMAPETLRQALYNFADRQRLNTGDESHDELLKAVERVRNSNGMYTLDELARNNDRGWTAADIAAAEAELDGAAAPVDMSGPGGRLYQRGEEALQEARLGLSDLQELAYGAAESAGENIALGLVSPGLLLGEQALRSAGGGIADSAAAGQSAGQSLLSGLGHGAVSAGIEQIGIGQMMRNMGRATGMSRVTDDILDRIAALPGMDRLAPSVAGIVANAGEEAAEEFAQTYADTAVDALLGRETPGLLSGELLGEAAQSALGGAVGGGLIGGISSGIGAVQDVRQGRIAPRADLVANANLSATIEQAGQIGRAQQAAAGTAQAQQEQQAAAQVQQAALEAAAESATTAPQQRTVDPQLAELAAQSGGRLDASAWRTMQQPQAENAESLTGNAETLTGSAETLTAQDQRRAVRQNWTDEQRAEAMLLEANTSMTEAAVNTAVEAMPADVSGDVYSVAANTVYQLSRQGIAEDWGAALDLASRSGVRVNQILAAPGGAEALQMIYNRGQMDGIEAAGYSAAGLADERRAGQVQYQPGALVPEEDKMLFDLYAAASDTAVTVSDRLEKNAGGYVDTALGKVYFGAEAGADTFGTVLHESVHQYNAWDEAGGRELQTATLRYLAEQQGFESVNDLVESYIQRYQEAGQELSYAQACEEITADAMRGVFGSEETFARWVEHQRALAEQNGRQRSTIAKVMDHVREMLDKVISKAKSILNREPGNAAARQAQALAESQKRALEELYYKHAETAMEAQRAARRSQNQTENVNKSEESANENQTGVASSQQNVASSQQNVASEGENVASERRYQLPEDTGIRTVNYSDYVDTSQENQDIAEREGLGEFGKSSPNGELKTAILYHGSYADFDRFDFEAGRAARKNGSVDRYGEGFYFTENPDWARNYGDNVYKVEVKYSTDNRTAKRTGREKDFTRTSSGYWVIPSNKADNIRILSKADASEASIDDAAKRYHLPVDEGQMESGQRAAAWENVDRAGLLEALQAAYEEKETHRVPEETIDRIARRIVSGEDSRADVKVVREQLVGLLNYAASGQADWDAVVAAAEGIADEVMKKSGHMDRSLWNEYKDLHYFTVKVKRGGTEYNELVYRYGSYAAAKREMARFGITLNTNEKNVARGIDQVYQELAGDYPGLFSAELTDPMEQLDRIAQVRQAIKPAYQNSYGESYEEARADLAMRIIGSAVAEGVTDTGVAGMLRQRIDENLNAHRAGVQRRVVNALNEQERTARDDAFRQMQRVVSASGEANRRRLEAEREAWAKTSDQMRTAMARSRDTAQRARDARNADNIRRQIAANRTKLNRMLLHPSDQYHVPPKLMQDALQVAELANNATYNEDTVTKLQALRSQLAEQAAANEGADSIAADWNSSGISEMLGSLASSMQRTSRRNARLDEQADAQARRLERGLNQLYDMQSEYENADFSSRRIDRFTVDELATLRDITSAMVTVIQNSNKLLATQTAQSAAEFASVARQEVEGSPSRLKDKNGKGGSIKERLLEFYNKYRANVYNAERIFNMLGGHRHGGAMEALGKSLAAGEAKQTAIREKGMQQFRDVLEGKENRKLLRRFAGQDAELIDVGFSTKINRAQMVSLYMHLQNAQNREHVLKGGVVIPDMKEYARGHIEKAYRTNRVERITEGTISAIEKELTTGEMADYCQKWITDLKELLNNYTKNVINETSRRLSGYDKAGVGDYYPIAVDRDVLQKEIEGVVYNGTIEGRGFLKSRQEHSKAPLLLEEASGVMARTLADAAAYGGLAPAIRDANKIWNANRNEQGSLRAAVRKNFGSDGVNFVENYIADLQQRPRTRKNIFDFLSGMRGNYAGAVLTLNPGVALGQVSGVAAAASDLGWKATWDAYREMLPNSAEHKERIRKEMMDHGYWQLEATLSDGPTAELNAVRQRSGAVQRVLERIPGTGWLENMDMKTRMALWEGSKYYVDHHLEEFGLPADAHGSDAWWGAVVSKMTEVNDRTQPNYTISQQSALQRDPSQLVKMLTMFRSQGFQNYGLVASAVEDVRAQAAYEEEYAQRAADTTLGEEERQQAQADLERVQRDKAAAWTTMRRAASGQVVSAAIFVAAKMLVDDWLLHRYDREKDEEGQITPASVAGRAAGMIAENLMGNVYGLSEVWNTVANLFGGGEEEPVSLTGVDAISDLSGDLLRLHNAVTEDELDPTKVRDRLIDLAGSVGNLTGVPVARLTRIVEGLTGWIGDISTAANSDGLNLWDVMNAPSSSASQYDRLYTAVFEEPDPEDAAAALKRLADLDELTLPAKASNAKAGDSKLLTELLKREREYGSSVQDAAAARVAGNEAQQRQIRQELVNTLAGALGIDQNTKEGQRRLRTVINKVDGAITDEVREQMGADSKTGATVYTPLLAALEDGGDPAAAQTVLRRAGITDSNIKSAVQGVYKDEYIYGDESTRQRIERQLLQLKDANGEPYFTKTRDQDDFADWVTDWELQGLNDSVYTDLDEALATGNKAAAKDQIDRYMTAGKSADSIRNRMASLYKQEYINADSARRREITQFLVGLRGPKGEKIVTVDTLTKWIMDDAMAKATAGR